MSSIIKICDTFVVEGKGVVVGGVNSLLDDMSLGEIKQLIGDMVEIHKEDGSTTTSPVLGVEVSTSLVGRKNIFLLLPLNINLNFIKNADVETCVISRVV